MREEPRPSPPGWAQESIKQSPYKEPIPNRSPRPSNEDDFNMIDFIFKWGGPLFILLGLIFGASYLVNTSAFGPPERLTAGIVVTALLAAYGQFLYSRGKILLSDLIMGTSISGAFLCAWAIPFVTDVSDLGATYVALLVTVGASVYAFIRNNSMTLAVGIFGFFLLPLNSWLYSEISLSGDLFWSVYYTRSFAVPMLMLAALSLAFRVKKGWVLPWVISATALFAVVESVDRANGFNNAGNDISMNWAYLSCLAIIISTLVGFYNKDQIDDSFIYNKSIQGFYTFLDAIAPIVGFVSLIWLVDLADFVSKVPQRIIGLLWIAILAALALALYNSKPRKLAGFVSSGLGLILILDGVESHIYVVILSAIFVIAAYLLENDESNIKDKMVLAQEGFVSLGVVTHILVFLLIATGFTTPLYETPDKLVSTIASLSLLSLAAFINLDVRKMWGLPYALWLLLPIAVIELSNAWGLITISLVWVLVGAGLLAGGVKYKDNKSIWFGLITILIAAGKILLLDLNDAPNLARAVTLIGTGLVAVIISSKSDEIKKIIVDNRKKQEAEAFQPALAYPLRGYNPGEQPPPPSVPDWLFEDNETAVTQPTEEELKAFPPPVDPRVEES